jgi:transposase-like protein
MQPTYLRDITEDEKNSLYEIMDNDAEADYRAEIILLSEDYTVAEIRRQTNHHDNDIRKWIHRFNSHGIDGIASRKHNHTTPKITDDIEKEIIRIASTNPRKLGLKFSTRSLRILVGYVMEKRIINSISHTEI